MGKKEKEIKHVKGREGARERERKFMFLSVCAREVGGERDRERERRRRRRRKVIHTTKDQIVLD